MYKSFQIPLLYLLLICSHTACQNAAESKTKTAIDNQAVQKKAGEPDLSEFSKVETKAITPTKATDQKEKTQVKSETATKPKPEKTKSDQKRPIKKKPIAKKTVAKKPAILFEEPVFDFGEITEGDIIKHKFSFKNTGNADLVIKSAHASCGCTDPSYPFIATPPGEVGYIGVTYNSVSKDGPQKPEVTIKTNVDNSSFVLYLSGNVVPKEEEEKFAQDSIQKKN